MAIKSFTRSTIENNIFYRSMLAGNTAYEPPYEDVLAEEILTSSQASVTFTGLDTLAAGYQHLQIRASIRTTRSNSNENVRIQFNNDTGSNYTRHAMYGRGSSVISDWATSQTSGFVSTSPAATAAANSYGAIITDILDPFETGKATTIKTFYGSENWDEIGLSAAAWTSTSAVTEIDLLLQSGGSFDSGCSFTLIGVK